MQTLRSLAPCLWGSWERLRVPLAKRATNCSSSSLRRSAFRWRLRWRTASSAKHSASALANAASSTNRPCRSYRFRARLHLSTTVYRRECSFARRVNAVLPDCRKGRPTAARKPESTVMPMVHYNKEVATELTSVSKTAAPSKRPPDQSVAPPVL